MNVLPIEGIKIKEEQVRNHTNSSVDRASGKNIDDIPFED
jgi:hypothetical protein